VPLRLRSAAPLVGVALLAHPVESQTPPDTVRLADVVVTATRTETPRREVPATVTVVTGEELARRGIRFVLDWLREVPGVTVVQNGSFGAVAALFLRGGESDYTRVLVDGVPVNLPGGAMNLAHLSTGNVERIEVLRGPASVLYGSDAVAGVIHILTRRGAGPGRLEGTLRAGSLGTTDAGASWSGGVPHGSWSAAVSRYETSGIYFFNNRYRALEGSGRLGLHPDDRSDVALAVRWGSYRAHFPTDFAGVPTDSNQFTADQALALSLDAGRRVGARTTLRVLAGVFEGDGAYDNRRDGPADTLGFAFEASRTSRTTRRSLDLRAITRASESVQLAGGVEFSAESERQTSATTSNFGGGATTDSDAFEHTRQNLAPYAQVVWRPTARAGAQLGARLDDNDVFGGFVTGRVGVVLHPVPTLRVHAAAGTAFKAPTFSEQFADTPFEVGDPGLVPERAVTWEAGAEAALARGRVNVSATWFDQRMRDMIQYRFTEPGAPTYVNLARASSRGVELVGDWTPGAGLSFRARWTGLRTRVEEAGEGSVAFAPGARLLRRPASTLAAGIGWRVAGAAVGVDLVRTGARDDVDYREFPVERVTLPGFTVVNASAEVPAGPVSLVLSARNVFDTRYDSVVGFPGIGRVILAGVRLSLYPPGA
jgi:vitamin B12 transporter